MKASLVLALLAVVLFEQLLLAQVERVWDGSSSDLWSVGANWVGGSRPENGDRLTFPGGTVTRRTIINDIVGLRVTSAGFQDADSGGYIIRGEALTITGNGVMGPSWGSQANTSNRIELDITLDDTFLNAFFTATGAGALAMAGDLTIRRFTTLRGDNGLHISGAISGTGDVESVGNVVFSGTTANTYAGTTFVSSGTLQLNKSRFIIGTGLVGVTSIPGDLQIGSAGGTDIVRLLFQDQIANTSNVRITHQLDLNGNDETIASLTLGGGVVTNGGTLTVSGGIDAITSTLVSRINSDLSLPAGAHTIAVSNNAVNPDLEIIGTISGAGNIVKTGPGTVAFGGAAGNTYSGSTTVNEGVLQLSKTGGFALRTNTTLIIGQNSAATPLDIVRHTDDNQLSVTTDILINSSGVLDLNGFTDDIGDLNLVGGTVQSGAGTIQLRGNVTAVGIGQGFNFDQATIAGNLDLGTANRTFLVNNDFFLNGAPFDLAVSAAISGTAGIIKTGPGELQLGGVNTFGGAVTVNDGTLVVQNAAALGAITTGTAVNNDATLRLNGVLLLNEPLTLNSTNSGPGALLGSGTTNLWTGPITLARTANIGVEENSALTLQCPLSGVGGLEKEGEGLLKLSGNVANTYTGVTVVKAGTLFPDNTAGDAGIPGNIVVGDGVGGVDADILLYSLNQLNNQSRVTIAESGKMIVGSDIIGSLSGTGRVEVLNTGQLRLGANNDSTTYDGLIIGGGGIAKRGTGIFTLTRNNTYTGPTLIEAGTLIVNGSQTGSDVTVRLDTLLGGRGSIGALTVDAGGTVSPGVSPARITTRGATFANEASLLIELNGPAPGSQYDTLTVNGTVDITSSDLDLTLNHAPPDGHVFVLVDNNGTDPVTGEFDLLPNGSIITRNQIPMRLNYNGGTGNDITLTVTNLPLHAATAVVSTGDLNGRPDVNECNQLFLRVTNSSGVAVTGVNATLSTTTPNVIITEGQSAYPTIPSLGVRSNSVPFQFFTTPEFPCGAEITFVLTLTTPANGTYTVSYLVPTGTPLPPVTFNNNVAAAIPDGNALNSPLVVSGVSGGIAELSVSLHLTHNGLPNILVFLISPDGLNLPMVVSAAGSSLGTSCNAAGRMVLDDDATRTIQGGPAPYVGLFKPAAPLSLYNGKSGPRLNGTWLLQVIDLAPDTVSGVLLCWGLTITPAICTDGGGVCAPCNGPFIGSITTNDLRSTSVLLPSGGPTVCATSGGTFCNTANRTGFYDAFTFTNGGPDACVTVTLTTPCGTNQNALYSAAFLNQFNPSNVCASRIGFMGSSPDPESSYAFLVASNAVFTVIVSSVNTLAPGGCSNYVLSVDGFNCPVELGFSRSSTGFVVTWPDHATEYVAECTTNIAAPIWRILTNEPRAADGRLLITNRLSEPAAFYRLRRP